MITSTSTRDVAMLSLALMLLGACATPYKIPELDSRPAKQTEFQGILDLLKSKGGAMEVLFVHGMGTKSAEVIKGEIRQLSKLLGGPAEPDIDEVPVTGSKALVYRADFELPDGMILVRAIRWSPVMALLKSQLCYDQSVKSVMCQETDPKAPKYRFERATLNQEVKDVLLNDRLADAIIYQGKSRDAISSQIQTAILESLAPRGARLSEAETIQAAANATRPLVLVTDSLGSKITFDAVYKLIKRKDARAAGMRTLERTAQVFMRANQLPLLALADRLLDGTSAREIDDEAYPPDPLGALLKLRGEGSIKVVAFTDPNDLLSYTHATYKPPENLDYSVVDVVISTADTYFGLLENPIAAHTEYANTKCVKQLMRHGTQLGPCVRK